MATDRRTTEAPRGELGADFWKFWTGQTLSNLGSSVTPFILPLLIFRLTGSALDLSLATAASFLPYPLFGLVIGAWVDRVDRKRLMIATDLGRALIIASVPVLAATGTLPIWWLYLVGFLNSTLTICFNSAEFAAIPSLVAGATSSPRMGESRPATRRRRSLARCWRARSCSCCRQRRC